MLMDGETRQKIIDLLETGTTALKNAASQAGVAVRTYYSCRERDEDFAAECRIAAKIGAQHRVTTVSSEVCPAKRSQRNPGMLVSGISTFQPKRLPQKTGS